MLRDQSRVRAQLGTAEFVAVVRPHYQGLDARCGHRAEVTAKKRAPSGAPSENQAPESCRYSYRSASATGTFAAPRLGHHVITSDATNAMAAKPTTSVHGIVKLAPMSANWPDVIRLRARI